LSDGSVEDVVVSIASEDHIEPLLDCHGSSIDVGGHIALNECLQQRLARYGELLFKPAAAFALPLRSPPH
jgi:hypothetical protein